MKPETRKLIKAFIDNKEMAEVVKSVLLAGIQEQGTQSWVLAIDRTIPDAEYGQRIKSIAQAIQMLDNAYTQLHQLASVPDGVQSRKNEAR